MANIDDDAVVVAVVVAAAVVTEGMPAASREVTSMSAIRSWTGESLSTIDLTLSGDVGAYAAMYPAVEN